MTLCETLKDLYDVIHQRNFNQFFICTFKNILTEMITDCYNSSNNFGIHLNLFTSICSLKGIYYKILELYKKSQLNYFLLKQEKLRLK